MLSIGGYIKKLTPYLFLPPDSHISTALRWTMSIMLVHQRRPNYVLRLSRDNNTNEKNHRLMVLFVCVSTTKSLKSPCFDRLEQQNDYHCSIQSFVISASSIPNNSFILGVIVLTNSLLPR